MSARESAGAAQSPHIRYLRRKTANDEVYDGEPPAKSIGRSPASARFVTVQTQRFKPKTIDEFAQFLDNDANRVADMDIWSMFGEGNYINYRVKLVITALLEKIDRLQKQRGGLVAPVYEEVQFVDLDDFEPTIIAAANPPPPHTVQQRRPAAAADNSASPYMFLENPPMPREYYDVRPTLPDLRSFNLLDAYTVLKHRRGAGGFRMELKRLLIHMTRMIHTNAARGQYAMVKTGFVKDPKKKQYPRPLIEHVVDCIATLITNVDGTVPEKFALTMFIKDTWIAVLHEDRRNPPRFPPFSDEELEALSGDGRHYVSNAAIRRKVEPESSAEDADGARWNDDE